MEYWLDSNNENADMQMIDYKTLDIKYINLASHQHYESIQSFQPIFIADYFYNSQYSVTR